MLFNTREQNQLYLAIREVGFDPSEFDVSQTETIWRAEFRPTGDWFRLNESPAGLRAGWKIADDRERERSIGPFRTALEVLRFWLHEVKAEMEAPDLWAELQQQREILLTAATTEVADNAPFTPEEQSEISAQLHEIKEYMEKTYELTAKQTRALEAALDDIRTEAGHMRRRQWFTYAVGAITILEAVLPQGTPRHMFLMLVRSLAHLRGFPELPTGG
jgi:hypothetical protein